MKFVCTFLSSTTASRKMKEQFFFVLTNNIVMHHQNGVSIAFIAIHSVCLWNNFMRKIHNIFGGFFIPYSVKFIRIVNWVIRVNKFHACHMMHIHGKQSHIRCSVVIVALMLLRQALFSQAVCIHCLCFLRCTLALDFPIYIM